MVNEPPRTRRRNMLAETRLLSEWLAENYFGRELHFQYRVGTTPEAVGVQLADESERTMQRNFNRRVDAIVAPPPDLVLIEATMWRATEKIGRLEEYGLLLRATPDWQRWRAYPLRSVLLTAQHDPVAQEICRRRGIEYVWWEPPWIDDFYAAYPNRKRRAPHSGMVESIIRQPTPPAA
jgi:hypothetical protein